MGERREGVSRRDFLALAASAAVGSIVGAAAAHAALPPKVVETERVERVEVPKEVVKEVKPWLPEKWDEEADVVVVGAGAAGLSAAIEAAENGAKVLVLEKRETIGGNTSISTAWMNAAGTSIQKQFGVLDDSPDIHFEDTMKGGDYKNDPKLVRILVDEAPKAVEWLKSLGAPFPDLTLSGGSSKKRSHMITREYGAGLIKLLYENAIKKGVTIRTGTKVINLCVDVVDDTRIVRGVIVKDKNGNIKCIKARAIILACGGFGANPELVERYDPSLKGFATTNIPDASTGECMIMAMQYGADTANLNYIQIHPTVYVFEGKSVLITEGLRGKGFILVNVNGQRFVNELERRDIVSKAILNQPYGYAWLIGSKDTYDAKLEEYKAMGIVVEANTIEDLALKTGIASDKLKETIQTYNKYVEMGKDPEYGRPVEKKIETPPFYAIRVKPAVHYTMGGLRINEKAQVIDVNGRIIQRLYAAGEVTGGIHGTNRLGGNAIADCIVFGRIAGKNAAAEQPWY